MIRLLVRIALSKQLYNSQGLLVGQPPDTTSDEQLLNINYVWRPAHSHSLPAGLLPSSPEEPDIHTQWIRQRGFLLLHSLTSHQCSYPCLSLECLCQVNIAFLLPTGTAQTGEGTAQTGECIVQHETLLAIMDVDVFHKHLNITTNTTTITFTCANSTYTLGWYQNNPTKIHSVLIRVTQRTSSGRGTILYHKNCLVGVQQHPTQTSDFTLMEIDVFLPVIL